MVVLVASAVCAQGGIPNLRPSGGADLFVEMDQVRVLNREFRSAWRQGSIRTWRHRQVSCSTRTCLLAGQFKGSRRLVNSLIRIFAEVQDRALALILARPCRQEF